MEVLVKINTKSLMARRYVKLLKMSPEFTEFVTPASKGLNPETAEALKEIAQKKGKRYTSVNKLMSDLKKL
jgi:hypothetical protein